MTPLHGTKTHPLSRAARDVLASIARAPMPRQEVNPGVANRLEREALVERFDMPSPYRTVRGTVVGLRVTTAGITVLRGGPR